MPRWHSLPRPGSHLAMLHHRVQLPDALLPVQQKLARGRRAGAEEDGEEGQPALQLHHQRPPLPHGGSEHAPPRLLPAPGHEEHLGRVRALHRRAEARLLPPRPPRLAPVRPVAAAEERERGHHRRGRLLPHPRQCLGGQARHGRRGAVLRPGQLGQGPLAEGLYCGDGALGVLHVQPSDAAHHGGGRAGLGRCEARRGGSRGSRAARPATAEGTAARRSD